MTVPTIGRIVHYTLSEQDAKEINRRRFDAQMNRPSLVANASGAQHHSGNTVSAGDVYPLVITRVWGAGEHAGVNGQVLLDGNDTFWATSVSQGEGERHFKFPEFKKDN